MSIETIAIKYGYQYPGCCELLLSNEPVWTCTKYPGVARDHLYSSRQEGVGEVVSLGVQGGMRLAGTQTEQHRARRTRREMTEILRPRAGRGGGGE